MTHGGARDGAGRKSIFGVPLERKPFAMDFTAQGRTALDALTRRTALSRNAVLATLVLAHADRLRAIDHYPNKAQAVLSIRLPPRAAAKLRALQRRTDRSYSDIGEALVLRYGRTTTYPEASE